MRHANIRQAQVVPSYILNGVDNFYLNQRLERQFAAQNSFEEDYRNGIMSKKAFFDNVPNIRHGAGVYESARDMTIWELAGDVIYRRCENQREVEAVLAAIDEELGENSEEFEEIE